MSESTPDLSDQMRVDASDEEGFKAMFERVADEYGCDAVLTGGRPSDGSAAVERVLVPLRGDVNLDRILAVVADL